MKHMLSKMVFLLALMPMAVLAEDPRIHGESAEGPFYDFYLSKDLNGYVRTKESPDCDGCKEYTIKITPDVKAVLDGEVVPLKKFILSKHQPSILHFKNGKLDRIVWFSK